MTCVNSNKALITVIAPEASTKAAPTVATAPAVSTTSQQGVKLATFSKFPWWAWAGLGAGLLLLQRPGHREK